MTPPRVHCGTCLSQTQMSRMSHFKKEKLATKTIVFPGQLIEANQEETMEFMNSTLQNAHGKREWSNMEVIKIICFLVTQNHLNLKSYILNNTNSSHFKSSLTPTSLVSTHKSPLCSSSRPSSSNLSTPLIIYSPSSSVHCLTLSSKHPT